MRIDISEQLGTQLETLARDNFRTPKLQLEFILTRVFADGYFSLNPMNVPSTVNVNVDTPFLSSILGDDGDVDNNTHESGETLSDDDLSAIAEQTIASQYDPDHKTDGFGDSRRAFELANLDAQNKIPKPDKAYLEHAKKTKALRTLTD